MGGGLVAVMAAALLAFFSPLIVGALRFDLAPGLTKCFSEDIKNGAMAVGKYAVVNPIEGQPFPDSHKITLREDILNDGCIVDPLISTSFDLVKNFIEKEDVDSDEILLPIPEILDATNVFTTDMVFESRG